MKKAKITEMKGAWWQPDAGSPCAAEGGPVAPWNVRGWVSVS